MKIRRKYSFFNSFLLVSLLLGLAFLLPSSKVAAAEIDLPINQSVSGVLSKGDPSQTYKIVLPEAGRLSFNLISYVDKYTNFNLYNEKNESVFSDYSTGSSKSPAKYSKAEDLEPGTYYLKIYDSRNDGDRGSYTVQLSFNPAKNIEVEPNNGTVEAQTLAFNKEIVGFLSWNDSVDFYKITIPKSGSLTIDLSSYVDRYTNIVLMDESNDLAIDTYIEGSSKTPAKYKKFINLEPGVYYLKIYDSRSDGDTGKYQLKTLFTPVQTTEIEPNNGVVEAQAVSFNKSYTGFLAWNDSVDFYKINVPKSTTVNINLTSYVDRYTNVQLFDNNNEDVLSEYIEGSSKTPAKEVFSLNLNKGTYYLKVYDSRNDGDTGKYTFTITAPSLAPAISLQPVSNASTLIVGKTSANTKVTVNINNKLYTQNSNAKGDFSIKIPKQKAGVTIRVSAANAYGSKLVSTKVIDKTPPAAPSVNKVTSKSTVVTGKAEVGATISVYNGSKLLGKSTVTSKGTYSVKIKQQKKGTTLKVSATDKANNKSKQKVIKVQ
ncbi:Ig-like domain-containing protein [Bacillus sp. JJ722]|uniref:Ig-like domain-containing protein n=1 Tax=Bacillus sp. JJ722 TaxID=3122973 RepID=UPI0030009D56